ncbi:CoA transferase [Shinella curvata]|uniref:CoA transferase n=1 Tax=Shinella curvata TaxID=1817964 RepID=A0ABT8XG68_9HYPH|nr:CoA transferase [Shinella curvata]MCJ8053425.1 CoA transferase [Shinella curvata]MDO6122757.1 CoA transferase [Shinella curvata]
METTRRNLLGGGAAVAAASLSGLFSSPAMAAAQAGDFDISQAFSQFMQDIGGSAADAGGTVKFTGQDPIVRSRFRIGACMAIPAMAAAVGAAAIWRARTGETQDVAVDLRESVYNVMPLIKIILQKKQAAGRFDLDDPIPGMFTFVPTLNDKLFQGPLLLDNPMGFAVFQTRDDRFVTPTGLYPHHFDGILNLLGASPNVASITEAFRKRDAFELDNTFAEAGLVLGVHRTTREWADLPEAKHLAARPLIEIVKIADGDPIPFDPSPAAPLSGIKALSCTHVIAGSTAARTLSEYGAEVMHIARDQSFEHEIIWSDINIGMRSSFVNLRNPAENEGFRTKLLADADVFIESFRGRSMENLGFGVEEVASKHPGIVYLSVRCYSWDGPWWNRAGFDMEALTVSGFTLLEGEGRPSWPPTMVLNDYIAGYLGAAGIVAALRRRATEGGSYHVRVSLTRAAMWYQGLGMVDRTAFDPKHPDHRMIQPRTIEGQTPYGKLRRLAPQVQLSKTPGNWPEPLLRVRGADRPEWAGR